MTQVVWATEQIHLYHYYLLYLVVTGTAMTHAAACPSQLWNTHLILAWFSSFLVWSIQPAWPQWLQNGASTHAWVCLSAKADVCGPNHTDAGSYWVPRSSKALNHIFGVLDFKRFNTAFIKGSKSILLNGAEDETDWLLLCYTSYLPQAVVCHVSCVCMYLKGCTAYMHPLLLICNLMK